MPGSSGEIPAVNGTGMKSEATNASLVEVSGISTSAYCVDSSCAGDEATFASSGSCDCDETSFLGAGEDCPLERPLTVHRKNSSTAAAAPTLAHSKVRRHDARR